MLVVNLVDSITATLLELTELVDVLRDSGMDVALDIGDTNNVRSDRVLPRVESAVGIASIDALQNNAAKSALAAWLCKPCWSTEIFGPVISDLSLVG